MSITKARLAWAFVSMYYNYIVLFLEAQFNYSRYLKLRNLEEQL